jgi:hypothetical protein
MARLQNRFGTYSSYDKMLDVKENKTNLKEAVKQSVELSKQKKFVEQVVACGIGTQGAMTLLSLVRQAQCSPCEVSLHVQNVELITNSIAPHQNYHAKTTTYT